MKKGLSKNPGFLIFWFAWCLGCGETLPPGIDAAYQQLPDQIDFNFHVKPILSDKCFACHGPDAARREAELRLDIPTAAYAALKSNPAAHALVPRRVGQSEIYHRILSTDPEQQMPPPNSNLSLTEKEVATLVKWIEQGAVYKPHWSLIKPEIVSLPKVQQKDWAQNEIDHFVLSRLEQEGLQPSAQADKRTLIRRLSFDLTGLPPTLEAVENFVQDETPDAYTRLVDRLLDSQAYGERMAMDWMDVARYADSDGYLDDKHRDFTPWRDWVIHAFNGNMPYDQFVTWQLAGDLLPEASKESILATAFNRLHRKNSEAGIVFEEFRTEYVADRTNTFGKAFLGLSMECARCHDHKYDPISQEDYYSTFAFFNSTHESGTAVYGPDQTPGPALLLSSEEQDKIIAFLNKSIETETKELQEQNAVVTDAFKRWSENSTAVLIELAAKEKEGLQAYLPFDNFRNIDAKNAETPVFGAVRQNVTVKEPLVKAGKKGKGLFLDTYTSLRLPDSIGWFERTEPFSISLAIFPDTIYEAAGMFYHCEDQRIGYKGYSMHLENNYLTFIMAHSYPQNAIQVRTQAPLPSKEWTQVTLTYDGSSRAAGIHLYWNGRVVPLTVDYNDLYKTILFEPNIHTYGFKGFQLGEKNFIKVPEQGGIDELKIYERALTALEVLYQHQPEEAENYLNGMARADTKTLLHPYYQQHHNPLTAKLQQELRRYREQLNDTLNNIPEIMVMGDLPEPRPTYLLERGQYNMPGKVVHPSPPESILPFPAELPQNRLGLSRWLFDPEHPLTARVYVNRIWQMHFGRGIVASAEDFGNQGALPSHPELLDWLAVAFRESGWNIKDLHRKIVLSATYQQDTRRTPELLEKDPDNVLLARGPSFRLSAEMIRDNALAVSGLLVDKLGGASAYPYQPDGLWDEISNKSWRYPYLQEPGEGLYRRSLYTVFKRTSPPPAMLVFDTPDRSACTVRRSNTSTPLQALVLLNDPQYLEAARVLAEKLLTEYQKNAQPCLQYAFQTVIGRPPNNKEMAVLQRFYQDEVQRFTAEPEDAAHYLSIGEYAQEADLAPIQTAALATVIHGIMNTTDSFTLR